MTLGKCSRSMSAYPRLASRPVGSLYPQILTVFGHADDEDYEEVQSSFTFANRLLALILTWFPAMQRVHLSPPESSTTICMSSISSSTRNGLSACWIGSSSSSCPSGMRVSYLAYSRVGTAISRPKGLNPPYHSDSVDDDSLHWDDLF